MTRGHAMLHRLRRGIAVSARVAIVVAHPDDETFGLGGSIGLMPGASVVQLTDGVSPDSADPDVANTRLLERQQAWAAAGWLAPIIDCHAPDQRVHEHLNGLLDVLTLTLTDADVVITHPYEGGHPDHDAAAFLVQRACDRIGDGAPERIEFASYHYNGRSRRAGVFWPDRSVREWHMRIDGHRLAQKQRAFAAYRSQANIARWFDSRVERYRMAPRYDFTQPPPTPACLYERKGWPLTNAALRDAMARAA